jgi:hypothetical protein
MDSESPISDNESDNEDYAEAQSAIAPISSPLNDSFVPSTICLHVLRHGDPKEKWKIQAHFGDGLKHTFTGITQLSRPVTDGVGLRDMKCRIFA